MRHSRRNPDNPDMALARRIADDIAAVPIRLVSRDGEELCAECGGSGLLPDSMGLGMDTPCWRCMGESA